MTTQRNRKAHQDSTRVDALATCISFKMEIDERLTRLAEASEDHFHKDPDHITWGDASLLEHYNTLLKELTDKIFKEGEYAE